MAKEILNDNNLVDKQVALPSSNKMVCSPKNETYTYITLLTTLDRH